MHHPRAILFDLDRTLVDLQSFTDYASALQDLTDLVGLDVQAEVPDADWDAPTLSTMAILVALAGDSRWSEASDLVAAHERAAIARSVAMPGLAQMGEELQGLPRAVVTLLPKSVARAALHHHGIPMDVIVGRDPLIPAKPSGAGLVIAAQSLGVPVSQTVMIGDSSWDHAAAMDAGAAFIGVPVTEGAFGPGVVVAPSLLSALRRARDGS